jgi:PAS domain S-box-containing protein
MASIVESSDDAIISKDLNAIITSWNKGAERIFGYTDGEMVGTSILRLIPTDRWDEERQILEKIKRGETTAHFETLRQAKNGRLIAVSVTASPIKDATGNVTGVSKVARDITERKATEGKIRQLNVELEQRLVERTAQLQSQHDLQRQHRALLDNIPDIAWLKDKEGRYIAVNESLSKAYGHSPEEIIGKNDFDMVPADLAVSYRANDKRVMESRQRNRVQESFQDSTGTRTWIDTIKSPIVNDQGEVTGTAGIARDVTERKRAEDALQESNLHLQDALDNLKTARDNVIQQERLNALGTMASGITHDFNNSLTAILGCSELLLHRPGSLDDKEKVRSYVEMMNSAAQDAGKVVDRLREFYRHREKSEGFIPVSINEIVGQAVALTQPKWKAEAEAQGVSVDVHTDLQEVPLIAGNAANLREALTNLILNAVDAMPRGGTITIHTYRDDGYVMLEIGDTGTGMTQEVRRRCLEPFFTTKGALGTGLGLSMVYGILQRHQGTVEIETEVGKGTTFIIRLPVQTAQPRSEPKAQPVDFVQHLHVLVVDDEAAVRKIIGEYLKIDGHIVEVANCGRDGLEKFRNGRFDLVLVDRAMPDMSGDQVAAAVKSISPAMPVIMLTGFGSMMDAVDEKPAGVDLVVGKPVTISALRTALSKVVASVN